MRLIDADALWLVTEGDHQYYEKFEIENAPTVDAVEVVRCKDCCHCIHNEFLDTYCCWKFSWGIPTEKDGFCSWGEIEDEID